MDNSKPIRWSRRVARTLPAVVCTLICAGAASAQPPSNCGNPQPQGGGTNNQNAKPPPPGDCAPTGAAPEMDVSSAVGAVTLLLGGLLVLQGSQRRRPK
jgi:hypothetical protein